MLKTFFLFFFLLTLPLVASLDIADLYLRKIKSTEQTFFGKQGWSQNQKTRFEFFYETDYLMDAGTNNPELIKARNTSNKDPLAISDWGFFLEITSKKNPLDILFFNFNSKTMMVNPDHSNFYLSTIALAFPELVSYDNTEIKQSILGVSLKYSWFFDISYGLILDERRGINTYQGFYEINIPFFKNSFVRNLDKNKLDRYEGSLYYAPYNTSLGLRYKNTVTSTKHYYLSSNVYQNDWCYLHLGIDFNQNFNLANLSSKFVLHSSHKDASKEKFGSAYFITTSLNLINPQRLYISLYTRMFHIT